MEEKTLNRRQFLTGGAMLGTAAVLAPALLTSCNGAAETKNKPLRAEGEYYVPDLMDKAIEGRELKVGLIGCSG